MGQYWQTFLLFLHCSSYSSHLWLLAWVSNRLSGALSGFGQLLLLIKKIAFKDMLFTPQFGLKAGHTWSKNGICSIFTLPSRISIGVKMGHHKISNLQPVNCGKNSNLFMCFFVFLFLKKPVKDIQFYLIWVGDNICPLLVFP